jgi:integrase
VVKNRQTDTPNSGQASDNESGDPEMFKLPPYTELKADGHYRYRRRVPAKLVKEVGKARLYRNLGKTKEEVLNNWSDAHKEIEALFAGVKNNQTVEAEVFAKKGEREKVLHLVEKHYGKEASEMLALGVVDDNLEHALMGLADELHGSIPRTTEAVLYGGKLPDKVRTMSSVLDAYYEYKTTGDTAKDKRLHNRLMRVKADLVEALGEVKTNRLPIDKINRIDANTYRDLLLTRMVSTSVQRNKNTINAAFNWFVKENGLDLPSPFVFIIKDAGHTKNDRLPLTQNEVSQLNSKFKGSSVDVIYGLLRDTGARVGEVAGILVGDISLQNKTLHIKANSIRGLKNLSSERVVPLSDSLLGAIQVLRAGKEDDQPLFPKYARANGNTALSAILMKHLRVVVQDKQKSIHSLRHKMKDDLRNTGCDSSLADAILGHTTAGVGSRYGSGYKPEVMRQALVKVW